MRQEFSIPSHAQKFIDKIKKSNTKNNNNKMSHTFQFILNFIFFAIKKLYFGFTFSKKKNVYYRFGV